MGLRGLFKATAYYNNIEALKDWAQAVRLVEAAGRGDLVDRFSPPPGAGWRQLDRATAALLAALNAEASGEQQA